MDLEQLKFFRLPKSNSTKTSVSFSLSADMKKDITTVAQHYDISLNTVVSECLRLALFASCKKNIDFATKDNDHCFCETLVLHLKKTTVASVKQLAKEHNTSISSIIRKCIAYVLNFPWEDGKQKEKSYTALGRKVYQCYQENGITEDPNTLHTMVCNAIKFTLQVQVSRNQKKKKERP